MNYRKVLQYTDFSIDDRYFLWIIHIIDIFSTEKNVFSNKCLVLTFFKEKIVGNYLNYDLYFWSLDTGKHFLKIVETLCCFKHFKNFQFVQFITKIVQNKQNK